MGDRRRLTWGLPALALLAGAIVIVIQSAPHGPNRHGDGAGPLGSIGVSSREGDAVDPRNGARTWTYGMALCVDDGSRHIVLDDVGPTKAIGSYTVLGMGVRMFTPRWVGSPTDTPIISVEGWPPSLPDPIDPIAGYAVHTPCGQGPDAPYTEFLLGFGLAGPEGGGWEGVEVSYHVGSAAYVLHVDRTFFICGSLVDDVCGGPPFSTPSLEANGRSGVGA